MAREVAKIQDFKKIIDNWPGNWPAKQEFGKITGGPVADPGVQLYCGLD